MPKDALTRHETGKSRSEKLVSSSDFKKRQFKKIITLPDCPSQRESARRSAELHVEFYRCVLITD